MNRPIIAYYRVSTRKQERSGLGLEAQKQKVTWLAGEREAEIIASFTEVESGKRCDRVELSKALAQAKRTGATLVVAKLDRLSRNVLFTAMLLESGVDFVCCDNPHANRLTIHILAAIAEDEARRISQRTKDALAVARARGVKLGTPRMFTAEQAERGRATCRANHQRKCQQAYADLRELVEALLPTCTYEEIARVLNLRNDRTRQGCPWTRKTVQSMVLKHFHRGRKEFYSHAG